MMQRYARAALAAVGLWAGMVSAQVPLEWKFKEGSTFYLELTSTSKQVLKTVGRELKQDLEQTTVFSVRVDKIDEQKNVVLEQKLEWLSVKTTATSLPDDRYNQQLAGVAFKVTLNPKGEVIKLEGYDKMLDHVAKDDENARKAVKALLSEESLMKAAEEVFAFLPEKPVKTGDTWTREAKRSLGPLGTLQLTRKYSYDGPETVDGRSLERITFTGSGVFTPGAKTEAPFQFKVEKGDVKVPEYKGSVWFDAAAGRPVKSEWNLRIKSEVTIKAGESKDGIDTDQTQDLTVKMRVLDQKPEKPTLPGAPPAKTP
jgi:hypothetical protein